MDICIALSRRHAEIENNLSSISVGVVSHQAFLARHAIQKTALVSSNMLHTEYYVLQSLKSKYANSDKTKHKVKHLCNLVPANHSPY